jgi:hypothetical protein
MLQENRGSVPGAVWAEYSHYGRSLLYQKRGGTEQRLWRTRGGDVMREGEHIYVTGEPLVRSLSDLGRT